MNQVSQTHFRDGKIGKLKVIQTSAFRFEETSDITVTEDD